MWVQQGLKHLIAFSEEQIAILLHVARLRGFTVDECARCPHVAPGVDLEQIAARLVRPELTAVVKEGDARLLQPFLPRERRYPLYEPTALRHSGELPPDAKPISQLARRHGMNESGCIDQARRGLFPHYVFQRPERPGQFSRFVDTRGLAIAVGIWRETADFRPCPECPHGAEGTQAP